MLSVENLDVFYGDAQALDGVSLEVEQGAIVAIVGANGAGKTSLIRTIAGMLRPARGRDPLSRRRHRRDCRASASAISASGRSRKGVRFFPRSRLRKISTWVRCCRARKRSREQNRERVLDDVSAPAGAA